MHIKIILKLFTMHYLNAGYKHFTHICNARGIQIQST